MIEYIVIFLVVGVAAIYTFRKLAMQAKGKGCSGDGQCRCAKNHDRKANENAA